jgi:hypothetical protein
VKEIQSLEIIEHAGRWGEFDAYEERNFAFIFFGEPDKVIALAGADAGQVALQK